MITAEKMMAIPKNELPGSVLTLDNGDIATLVEWLTLKDNNVRYQAFLLLQHRSQGFSDVYPFWDVFRKKLRDANSFQRSIGMMLIAENAKWVDGGRMRDTLDDCFLLLADEKPITVRQCIQSLGKIALVQPDTCAAIAGKLLEFDPGTVSETMRKSVLLDIINTLLVVRKMYGTEKIGEYISNALAGGIIDGKSKKTIEAQL